MESRLQASGFGLQAGAHVGLPASGFRLPARASRFAAVVLSASLIAAAVPLRALAQTPPSSATLPVAPPASTATGPTTTPPSTSPAPAITPAPGGATPGAAAPSTADTPNPAPTGGAGLEAGSRKPEAGSPTAEAQKGLTLAQLKERARLRDPRAEAAETQVFKAQGKHDEVKWVRFPSIEYTLAGGGPTPEARLKGGDSDRDLTDITDGTAHGWGQLGFAVRAQATAVLPLYTFGKLSNGIEAAEHGVALQQALLDRARDQSVFDVTRAFWGYQTAHAGVLSVDSVRRRVGDAQKMAKDLLEEGSDQISRNDSLKIDYLKEELEAQYASTVKNERLAYNSIRALLGAALDEVIEVSRQTLPAAPELPDRAQMMARALEHRPEVRAAKAGVAARQKLVLVERGKLYPDLALIGGATFTYTSNASNPNTPFANNPYNERGAYVALALRGTLDVGQKLARLRQTEADLKEAEALARGAQQLIRLEVESALNDLEEARVKVDRFSREAAIGKQLALKAGLAFEGGLGTAREMLEDTLLFARADGSRLGALFDAQIALAALEKAVGGF